MQVHGITINVSFTYMFMVYAEVLQWLMRIQGLM